jgi:TatD DNase family protein
MTSDPHCVSVGELGLDYKYEDLSTPEEQKTVFEHQVQLAVEVGKPLFLHERQAHEDFVEILNKFKDRLPPCVVHCFTGNQKELRTYLDLGFYIGLTGYLWKDFSDDGVRSILRKNLIPLDKLMIETDAPFMCPDLTDLPDDMKKYVTPASKELVNNFCTEEKNEPCSLPLVLELISSLMNKDPKEVATATTNNAIRVFNLN